MNTRIVRSISLALALCAIALVATSAALTPQANAAAFGANRYLVRAQKGADLSKIEASINQSGGKVVKSFPQIRLMIVNSGGNLSASALQSTAGVAQVAHDLVADDPDHTAVVGIGDHDLAVR